MTILQGILIFIGFAMVTVIIITLTDIAYMIEELLCLLDKKREHYD